MKVKISTLSLKNSTRHLTGVIKIVILKLKNITIHRLVLPVLSSRKPFSKLQCQTGPAALCPNTSRRVLPALVLPYLRKAQLGVPLQGRHPSVAISIILFIVLTSITVTNAILSTNTSALTYQDSVDVSFTFDPTLSISLSSNNISIDNLMPGNYGHSNTITINVSTNNVYGYTLTAKVGEDGGGAGISASSDLVNASSDTPFTSLSSSDRIKLTSFNDNTWGYTTAMNINGDAIYSGLLYDADTTINVTRNANGAASSSYPGGGSTNFTIGASAANTQMSGNYTNTITFTVITNNVRPILTLYDYIADMSKGKNTDPSSGFSWTSITANTSGVYEWDGKTAGNGVDSNGGNSKIYFYRGILDTVTATYGSDGMADAYPNYVRLANNTCWRIVRTTSTGGVKMIYNGIYGDTTAGSCANAQGKAQTRYNNADLVVPFNASSSTKAGKTYTGLYHGNIQAVGYTYTSGVAAGTTETRTPAQLFGASGDDTTTNDKSSIIKQYIEDWYATNMTDYTSILEGDAGYCQDRRLNVSSTWITPLAEDSNIIIPYGSSDTISYSFGAYPRNTQSSTFKPLLTCPRGKVDLYSYLGNAGNGNGQLVYPISLLTADETSLAGSGDGSYNSHNGHSFLHSGSTFWLLSPRTRASNGEVYVFGLSSGSQLNSINTGSSYGVRPVISLVHDTIPTAGSGTATDPWIIAAP